MRTEAMKVSVCITAYNHENFIAQAIDSVLMQQVDFDYEILVGEDESSDGTRAIVKAYKKKFPDKIRLFLNSRQTVIYINRRPSGLWNFLNNIRNAKGKYIALLDGDDYWISPDKLQKQVNALEENPDCSICFHDAYMMMEDGTKQPFLATLGIQPKSSYTLEDILVRNFLPTGAVVFRNRFFKEFPNEMYGILAGDWFLHIMNARYGDILYIDELMNCYRIHGQGIWTSLGPAGMLKEKIRIYDRIDTFLKYKYTDLLKKGIYDCYSRLTEEFKKTGDIENSTKAAFQANYLSSLMNSNGREDAGASNSCHMSVAELNSYLAPPLTEENMDRYLIRSSILTAIKEFLPQCEGVLLDVGCGKMPYKSVILALDTRVSKYIGLDIENPVYQQDVRPDLFWNGSTIPLDDCSIDCAMATELFEHLPEPEKVMKEIRRVLKPNGLLFFTVPFLWSLHNVPNDEYRFTPFSLERHMRNSGFDEISIKVLGGWDASLAQMIGLWTRRKPMAEAERVKITSELFPLYRKLIESDQKPEQFSEGQMITGLYGTAIKRAKDPSEEYQSKHSGKMFNANSLFFFLKRLFAK